MTGISFLKGHGTGNDFVILPDIDGHLDLTPARIQAVCDRHFGLGANGVLAVRAVQTSGSKARYFMDYRNADGTDAEMCGNGARVFARYLVDAGLEQPGQFLIDTRGGDIAVECPVRGDVTLTMGPARGSNSANLTSVRIDNQQWEATSVWAPNPHAVAFVDDLAEVGSLADAPHYDSAVFPEGVNIEFVVAHAPDHLAIRIFERGVGETLSCGTGACAAAWVARRRAGLNVGPIRVDVPGGTVWVGETPEGLLTLTGPAVVLAQGEIDSDWWLAQ